MKLFDSIFRFDLKFLKPLLMRENEISIFAEAIFRPLFCKGLPISSNIGIIFFGDQ